MGTEHLKILIAGDEAPHVETISRAFKAAGKSVEIRVAGTLQEYRRFVENETPDIALMDLNLPDGRSMEVLTHPREKGEFPILIMTAHGNEQMAVAVLKAGALDYVVKSPEAFTAMPRTVERALREWDLLQEHRRAEESFRESEARYRALFENSFDAALLTVPDGTILDANRAACRMFGMSQTEICAVGRRGLVDATDPRLPVLLEERSLKGMASGELNFIRRDGTLFPAEVSSVLFKDREGQTKSSMVIRDITERKQKEEDLQRLNRTLLARSKSSKAMMSARDEAWYLNEVCRIIVEDCGHALVWIGFAEQDEGRTVRPVAYAGFEEGYLDSMKITWSDTEYGRGPVGTAIRTGKPSVFRDILGNPAFALWREEAVKRGYAAIIGVPILEEEKAFGSLNIYSRHRDPFSDDEVQLLKDLAADLSYGIAAIRLRAAQVEAESALQESERRYSDMLSNVELISITLDWDARVTFCNDYLLRLTGWRREEVLGADWFELFIPPGSDEMKDTFTALLANLPAAWHHENEILTRSGERRLIRWNNSVLRSPFGEVIGTASIGEDITERQRMEEALRASEHQYRQLLDNSLVGVYKTTLDGKFLYVNDAMARIFECENADEMLRLPVEIRYKRHEDREAFLNVLKEEGKVPYYEVEVPTKTGKLKTIVISAALEDGFITGMVSDITERRHLEAQLRHSQKMEAVGMLAGGIAHDFNNILNVIIGYGVMVLDSLEAGSPSKGQMNEVLAAAERAANLIKRLLVFSRKQLSEINPANVNELITDIRKMFVRIISENIDFQLNLADRRLVVMADAGQLEQVLLNLATNARDAMPEGGCLTISTGLQEIDDEYIALYGFGRLGWYAIITVADTGFGMDAETQKKIFEPFFSTKGIGEGTGLGLAISYGIIKQHNGFINVYSEPGQGTVFKIYLPLIEESALPDKKTDASDAVRGGNETVLVAEDDASLRKLSRIVLESFGYSVITADDGEDAITKFMENREGIDLAILDMIMPQKSGKEVGEVLRKASPRIKMLFVSGYTIDIIKSRELAESGFDFIQKPVRPQDLLRKVREVLDK